MIWVSIQKRKPEVSAYYYWKGKSNYGGREYYNTEIDEKSQQHYGFQFNDNVPVNKVDEDSLYWLDEANAQYEDRELNAGSENNPPQTDQKSVLAEKKYNEDQICLAIEFGTELANTAGFGEGSDMWIEAQTEKQRKSKGGSI